MAPLDASFAKTGDERLDLCDRVVQAVDRFRADDTTLSFANIIVEGQLLLELDDKMYGRALGVDRTTVGRWKSGGAKPHLITQKATAQVIRGLATKKKADIERSRRTLADAA